MSEESKSSLPLEKKQTQPSNKVELDLHNSRKKMKSNNPLSLHTKLVSQPFRGLKRRCLTLKKTLDKFSKINKKGFIKKCFEGWSLFCWVDVYYNQRMATNLMRLQNEEMCIIYASKTLIDNGNSHVSHIYRPQEKNSSWWIQRNVG